MASQEKYLPYDHADYTDESIETFDENQSYMTGAVTAMLNYNNTRLVVACGTDIWVYYPELDQRGTDPQTGCYGTTGWKKVLHFEPGVVIV